MANATLAKVLNGYKTALALPDATGDYTYDLSGGDRVVIGGAEWPPASVPMVYTMETSVTGEHGSVLGSYHRRVSIVTMAVVAADGETPEAHVLAASELADDLLRAIEAGRSDASGVFAVAGIRDIIVKNLTVAASSMVLGEPGFGVVVFTATIDYVASTGA